MAAPADLVRTALAAGSSAAGVVAGEAVTRLAAEAGRAAARLRAEHPGETPTRLAERVVDIGVRESRVEGAGAGVATTLAEVTSFIGTAGTLTIPATAALLAADLVALALVQARMVLRMAALAGLDPHDPARRQEILALQGLDGPLHETVAAAAAGSSKRWSSRLLLRRAAHGASSATGSLASLVGTRLQRTALTRAIPLLNVPLGARTNGRLTEELGERALERYFGRRG